MATKTTQADLHEETVADLRNLAKEAGITNTSHMTKDELISKLGEAPHSADSSTAHDTNAVELLKKDHAKVKSLFAQALKKEDGDKTIADIAKQIIHELEVHTEVEEKIFYPALKEKALSEKDAEIKDEVLEAYVEHDSVKKLIAQIKVMKPSDESYKAVLQVMSEQIEHHVEEEETEMFKDAKKALGTEQLERIGQKILEMKAQLTTK